MCYMFVSQKEAIIFLNSINFLVFPLETECVLWAVGREYANMFKDNLSIFERSRGTFKKLSSFGNCE